MKKLTIADHAAQLMAERHMKVIWFGCPAELHEIAERAGLATGRKDNPRGRHPMNVIGRVLAGLERSERFEKGYIQHLGRPARAFTLRKKSMSKRTLCETGGKFPISPHIWPIMMPARR